MIFLGNPASLHLATWRALYALRGREVEELFTIHPPRGGFPVQRRMALGGKVLSYVLLGLWLRISGQNDLVHAHGASGYGLSALISGRSYGVTIYGSELLARHGRLYNAMVRQVLRNARFVTVTSEEAAQRAREIEPALGDRLLCFHTGIDTARLERIAAERTPQRVPGPVRVMCLRNCGPQYRTREIVAALASMVDRLPPFLLTVPLGNGDPVYFARLRAEFAAPWIDYIDEPLSHEVFLSHIRDADICINFARSDQTSATLVEAIYLDRLIVTADLDAYATLFAQTADYGGWRVARDEGELAHTFAAAVMAVAQGVAPRALGGAELIAGHYSMAAGAAHLDPILKLAR